MVDEASMVDVVERVAVDVDVMGMPISSIRLSSPGSYGSSASASRLGEYGSASLPGEYGSESSWEERKCNLLKRIIQVKGA